MANYKLTKEEMETIILFDESSPSCEIYTCNKAWQTKLDKLCKSCPDRYYLKCEDNPSKTYETTRSQITFKGYRKPMTEEQKKANRKRFEQVRINKAQGQPRKARSTLIIGSQKSININLGIKYQSAIFNEKLSLIIEVNLNQPLTQYEGYTRQQYVGFFICVNLQMLKPLSRILKAPVSLIEPVKLNLGTSVSKEHMFRIKSLNINFLVYSWYTSR